MIKRRLENKRPFTPSDGFTTIEQSKRVEAAGIDPDTADFVYFEPHKTNRPEFIDGDKKVSDMRKAIKSIGIQTTYNAIPCWSLGRLLKVIPVAVEFKDQTVPGLQPLIMYPNTEVRYENGYDDVSFRSDDGLVECAVLAIERLSEKLNLEDK